MLESRPPVAHLDATTGVMTTLLRRIARVVVLPREITGFERAYLARVNRIALVFFILHVPVFTGVAWLNDTGPPSAALLTTVVLAGPVIAFLTLKSPRALSVVHGITAMCMGGVLVHFGQGPVQIEMHFYFFALVAMCCVFANPMVILAATATVALHHFLVWLAVPSSVFNYDAQWWVVAVHALFVVLEAIAACFIARSFFDNVIGLERIVQERTRQVDATNREMRTLLDNVAQGFVTIDRSGRLAEQHSAALDRWFGAPAANNTWFDYLHTFAPMVAKLSRLGWQEVVDDVMPLEVTLAQMPNRVVVGASTYRIEYTPIGSAEPFEACLVVVTDITAELSGEHAEEQRRETMVLFDRMLADRRGLECFVEDSTALIDVLRRGDSTDLGVVKRVIHTLKGNAALFGLASIARTCHGLEDRIEEIRALPSAGTYDALAAQWQSVVGEVRRLLGERGIRLELDTKQVDELEVAASEAPRVARLLARFKLEPTRLRLRHLAEQGARIAENLEKSEIEIHVEDHDVRLDRVRWAEFWSAFVHAVRNAIDHGIEAPDARELAGKPAAGSVWLRTIEYETHTTVEIEDDGAGIDWTVVRDRARSLDLPSNTHADLEAALFADGLSTKAIVTELSGRGIGMGALREATKALGGAIRIDSMRGLGTTIRIEVPHAAAALAIAS
jgi:two-component system, chemotaxis family, sensor kinase CheA